MLAAGLILQDLNNIIINQMALFAIQPGPPIIDQLATTVTGSPYPDFLIIDFYYISRIIVINRCSFFCLSPLEPNKLGRHVCPATAIV
jgi:hypothetical protein